MSASQGDCVPASESSLSSKRLTVNRYSAVRTSMFDLDGHSIVTGFQGVNLTFGSICFNSIRTKVHFETGHWLSVEKARETGKGAITA